MKALLALFASLLLAGTANAGHRVYHQGELDALVAPIALHPDPVVSQVLVAATLPDQVAAAASWSRANPHLRGEDAVRAAHYEPWDPSVKALLAFPDLLARMAESPQWLHDLGEAFLLQQAQVMDAIQALRRRAHAGGYLASSDEHAVYAHGEAIVVQPRTEVIYVRYYDPYVVYGPWWWPHYRPVFWRPWAPRPVFIAHTHFHRKPDWHRRHIHHHRHHAHAAPTPRHHVVVTPHVRVPEAQRKPIIQSAPVIQSAPALREPVRIKQLPPASGFTQQANNQNRGRPLKERR